MSYRPGRHRSFTRGPQPTIVTNSPRFIRGHDLATGRERWRLQIPMVRSRSARQSPQVSLPSSLAVIRQRVDQSMRLEQ